MFIVAGIYYAYTAMSPERYVYATKFAAKYVSYICL